MIDSEFPVDVVLKWIWNLSLNIKLFISNMMDTLPPQQLHACFTPPAAPSPTYDFPLRLWFVFFHRCRRWIALRLGVGHALCRLLRTSLSSVPSALLLGPELALLRLLELFIPTSPPASASRLRPHWLLEPGCDWLEAGGANWEVEVQVRGAGLYSFLYEQWFYMLFNI